MVNVTDRAKEELKRILEQRNLEPGKCLRLATPPVWKGEGDFGIVIDEERDGDSVVSFQGFKVLLVDSGIAQEVPTGVLDFKESPEGARFTLDVY
ncbi:MAG: hypothetical protein HYX93_03030 [Chloroflexi bacterium]|nr:hypothetical protein [Chloroflexota bacterium]